MIDHIPVLECFMSLLRVFNELFADPMNQPRRSCSTLPGTDLGAKSQMSDSWPGLDPWGPPPTGIGIWVRCIFFLGPCFCLQQHPWEGLVWGYSLAPDWAPLFWRSLKIKRVNTIRVAKRKVDFCLCQCTEEQIRVSTLCGVSEWGAPKDSLPPRYKYCLRTHMGKDGETWSGVIRMKWPAWSKTEWCLVCYWTFVRLSWIGHNKHHVWAARGRGWFKNIGYIGTRTLQAKNFIDFVVISSDLRACDHMFWTTRLQRNKAVNWSPPGELDHVAGETSLLDGPRILGDRAP